VGWIVELRSQLGLEVEARQVVTASLSGIFAECVQAGRRRVDLLTGDAIVTVVVRWIPELSARCGTRLARPLLNRSR
jgi:hypothetical protein